jgi:hypothetical protein
MIVRTGYRGPTSATTSLLSSVIESRCQGQGWQGSSNGLAITRTVHPSRTKRRSEAREPDFEVKWEKRELSLRRFFSRLVISSDLTAPSVTPHLGADVGFLVGISMQAADKGEECFNLGYCWWALEDLNLRSLPSQGRRNALIKRLCSPGRFRAVSGVPLVPPGSAGSLTCC